MLWIKQSYYENRIFNLKITLKLYIPIMHEIIHLF